MSPAKILYVKKTHLFIHNNFHLYKKLNNLYVYYNIQNQPFLTILYIIVYILLLTINSQITIPPIYIGGQSPPTKKGTNVDTLSYPVWCSLLMDVHLQ